MKITYMGHDQFYLQSETGFALLTDPFDPYVNFPMQEIKADAVTISHEHDDHNYIKKVTGTPTIIRTFGVHKLTDSVSAEGIPSFHDEEQGAKRGKNMIYKIKMDGLTVTHLGDLGHLPDSFLYMMLSRTDILLTPVGGFYTIDAKQAAEICRNLKPRTIIPMHYKTEKHGLTNIAMLSEFLEAIKPLEPTYLQSLEVTRESLSSLPPLAVLDVSAV